MPPPDEPAPPRRSRVLVAALISAVVIGIIVIHLTGVIGPGSH